jgi:hypothetical protein
METVDWLMALVMVGFLWGIPCWLIVRTWHKYRRWKLATQAKSTLAGLSLLLISSSTVLWFLLYPLSLLFKDTEKPFVSRGVVGGTNFLLCLATLFLSVAIPRTLEGVRPTRRALMAVSAYMLPIWIFLLTAH